MQLTINNKHFTDYKSKSIKVDMHQNNHVTIDYFVPNLYIYRTINYSALRRSRRGEPISITRDFVIHSP